MSKIALIVSDDARFSKMLSLELADINIETVLESEHYDMTSGLSYIIADLDSCEAEELQTLAGRNVPIVGFSNSYPEEIPEKTVFCQSILHRPFVISEFMELFEGDGESLHMERKSKQGMHTKKLNYLSLDNSDKAALWGDVRIPLSDNEYRILSLLCDNRGELVERDRIDLLLGVEEGNMSDVYICHLRRKIDNKLGLKLIYTVRGKGYMLKN